MRLFEKEPFVCLDCEATGLSDQDRICEIAIAAFTLEGIEDTFHTLIDPEMEIPQEVQKIHGISNEMCAGKPKMADVLPKIVSWLEGRTIVGHSIGFDLALLERAALAASLHPGSFKRASIDTLRLARLYGESPSNSLEVLRRHFNIEETQAHRAMDDVFVNIEVFRHLSRPFRSLDQMFERLKKPILFKFMPLGKYKGRMFSEIPLNYLVWASKQDYDQDLRFSIKEEIKKRRAKNTFIQAANPFSQLM